MNRAHSIGVLALSLLAACGGGGQSPAVLGNPPPPVPPPAPPPDDPETTPALLNVGYPLGVNLEGLKDWSRSIPFTDVFKLSRPWVSHGGPLGDGAPLNVDADGWVTSMAPGEYCSSYLVGGQGGNYPAGRYTCFYDGDGGNNSDAFFVQGEGSIVPGSGRSGRFEIDFTPGEGVSNFVIFKINPADHIRNIRIVMPGFESTYATTDVFHPAFLDSLKTFRVLRFMDWGETNNSEVVHWTDRTPPTAARFSTSKGAPVETMIALCNKTGADMWYCVPHMADDDYVRRVTTLIRDTLDKRLRLHLEFSNEVWNFGFVQAHWSHNQGSLLWPGDTTAWVRYYGLRAAQVLDIAAEVFGTAQRDRLVRVVSTQWGWPHLGSVILDQEVSGPGDKVHQHADVFAVAPYFSVNVYTDSEASYAAKSVEEILDICAAEVVNNSIIGGLTDINAALAHDRGLALVAYEGGQSCVAVGAVQNNQTIVDLFIAANRHPRMRQLYLDDLNGWTARGGTTFMQFSHTGSYGKYGCWGLLERQEQDRLISYKWLGIHDWLTTMLD